MLTKSQARLFFVGGTVFFSAIFIALTLDTVRAVPERSNEDRMTPAVVRGKTLWDEGNCMGCHTILGEGAYYAPELTRVVERRGEPWIALFLKDPQAMFPGERRMADYGFDDAQIADLVAFLGWIGEIDTNGFPPAPDLTLTGTAAAPSPAVTDSTPESAAPDTTAGGIAGDTASSDGAASRMTPTAMAAAAPPPEVFTTICIACHAVGGKGGAIGPALDGVASRKSREELDRWLADPQSVKPGTAMPKLEMDDATRHEVVAWLSTLE